MLENLEPLKHNRISRIDEVMETLDAKDQKILLDALNNRKWSAHGLSNALKARGVLLSGSTIKRYRDANREK